MDFLVEFLRSSIEFVIMGGVALLGIFLGVKLRKKKNNSEKNSCNFNFWCYNEVKLVV